MSHYSRKEDLLFSQADWYSTEELQVTLLAAEIDKIESNRFLNTSIDDLCDFLKKKYLVEIPVLLDNEILADQFETQSDVSHDPMRLIRNRDQSVNIPGTKIEITVPFKGDPLAFRIRPTTYSLNPPRATIKDNNLILSIEGIDLEPEQVRFKIDRILADIKSHLDNLQNNANSYNNGLRGKIKTKIESRRKKLLADQKLVSGLGFNLKERTSAHKTYASPKIKRKLVPSMPKASTAPFKPEPVLTMDDYEHILTVMGNMTIVMERSPSAFYSINEEALRTHFLVQLNGQYEGQATGETFNYEGKTDILIRTHGRNIFIAECKYWEGQQKLMDTIDQLLGYISWRDTKVAIVVFNRLKNFSTVLEKIPETMKKHPNFKKDLNNPSESSFRYIFAHRDDPNREMTLTVMAFDVPNSGKNSSSRKAN